MSRAERGQRGRKFRRAIAVSALVPVAAGIAAEAAPSAQAQTLSPAAHSRIDTRLASGNLTITNPDTGVVRIVKLGTDSSIWGQAKADLTIPGQAAPTTPEINAVANVDAGLNPKLAAKATDLPTGTRIEALTPAVAHVVAELGTVGKVTKEPAGIPPAVTTVMKELYQANNWPEGTTLSEPQVLKADQILARNVVNDARTVLANKNLVQEYLQKEKTEALREAKAAAAAQATATAETVRAEAPTAIQPSSAVIKEALANKLILTQTLDGQPTVWNQIGHELLTNLKQEPSRPQINIIKGITEGLNRPNFNYNDMQANTSYYTIPKSGQSVLAFISEFTPAQVQSLHTELPASFAPYLTDITDMQAVNDIQADATTAQIQKVQNTAAEAYLKLTGAINTATPGGVNELGALAKAALQNPHRDLGSVASILKRADALLTPVVIPVVPPPSSVGQPPFTGGRVTPEPSVSPTESASPVPSATRSERPTPSASPTESVRPTPSASASETRRPTPRASATTESPAAGNGTGSQSAASQREEQREITQAIKSLKTRETVVADAGIAALGLVGLELVAGGLTVANRTRKRRKFGHRIDFIKHKFLKRDNRLGYYVPDKVDRRILVKSERKGHVAIVQKEPGATYRELIDGQVASAHVGGVTNGADFLLTIKQRVLERQEPAIDWHDDTAGNAIITTQQADSRLLRLLTRYHRDGLSDPVKDKVKPAVDTILNESAVTEEQLKKMDKAVDVVLQEIIDHPKDYNPLRPRGRLFGGRRPHLLRRLSRGHWGH